MPTKHHTTAARLTAKQRACTHPPQHVHPTYDDRWETCDLCHLIRPRPLPAPWIVEWDESQPAEPVPALFAEPAAPTPAPSARATAKKRAPATTTAAAIVREQPETFADLLRAARRDRQILGREQPWQSPPLDDADAQTCHRCGGAGTIQTRTDVHPSYPFPHTHYEPDPAAPVLTCPRCHGAGRIAKYTA